MTLAVLNLMVSRLYHLFPWLKDRTIEVLKEEKSKGADDCFFCNLEYFTCNYTKSGRKLCG